MAKSLWVKRIVFAALIAEIAYVILVNLALRLPVTQTLINQIKPDKFYISWESAWTFYPFRFHIRNASGSGQSRSQQWEFEVQSVSASIDVLPLVYKRVWINHVRISNANYYQRPRLKPDKDYSGLISFYPPISGREITDAVTTPKKKKRAWHVDIEDIRLDGQYRYWVHHFKGQAHGTLEADLDVVSRGGLFSLTVPEIDLELGPHFIKESRELFRQGAMSGELGFTPFVPRENKGSRILQYLLIDADTNIYVSSLAFIDLFTHNYRGLKMNGTGWVDGHLRMEEGRVLDGTDLSIDADNLNASLYSHNITGNGSILIEVGPETRNKLDLDVRFNDMVVAQDGEITPLLVGQGLVLHGISANDLLRIDGDMEIAEQTDFKNKMKQVELRLKVPSARVADMSVFNHYIPPASPLAFTRGSADLEADILLKHDDADGYLRLDGKDMEALVDDQSIRADLRADISLVDGMLGELFFDISGSELRLDNVRVVGENESFNQKNWAAILTLTQAEAILSDPVRLNAEANLSMTDSRPIVAMLGNQKNRPQWIKNMLTVEDISGNVELDFVSGRLAIPNAFMNSDNIEFGAKGIIDKGQQDGMIYARYKKLDIVVKISEGKKNIDLIRARGKYDEYQLPAALDREVLPDRYQEH